MNNVRHFICAVTVLLTNTLIPASHAELYTRLEGAAVYDDVLDITWLSDAGLSGSQGWDDQLAWIDNLNASNHLGFSDWRMASMSVSSGLPTGTSDSVYDCSEIWQPLCADNELGYMFYYNLGGSFGDDLTGDHTIGGVVINNVQPTYSSGTEFGISTIWMLHFDSGFGVWTQKNGNRTAWAVRNGDVFPDADRDGIADSLDNCLIAANPLQIDSDGDGYGNYCDQDLDNDGLVAFGDIFIFASLFGGAAGGIADFNGDNVVNFIDHLRFAEAIFLPPGPSGIVP